MKAWSAVFFFFFCLPFASLILNQLAIVPGEQRPELLPFSAYSNPLEYYKAKFNLQVFAAVIGGSAIGILGYIFRVGAFTNLALIIWALCCFTPIISDFVTAFPNFMLNVTPPELHVWAYMISAFVYLMGFMFLMQLMTQRSVET